MCVINMFIYILYICKVYVAYTMLFQPNAVRTFVIEKKIQPTVKKVCFPIFPDRYEI